MIPREYLIAVALVGHIRVNDSNKTVEIYDEHGVKAVLRNLSDEQYEAFKSFYPVV